MFILNPDPYSLPSYRIGPFVTSDVSSNHCLEENNVIDYYFDDRFGNREYHYTSNGRKAINIALSQFNLQSNDVVTILTTTGNFYISGCVTNEIEKFCKWSRTVLPETKVLLVNHEFGYPFEGIGRLRELNIPIIEDCAGSFFSHDPGYETGNTGDYVIYSFPKMFPLQVGGLLLSNTPLPVKTDYRLDDMTMRHVKNVLSHYIGSEKLIIEKRLHNYEFLRERFAGMGFSERFSGNHGVVPGVFMFRTEGHNVDLPELKKYYWAHGVQCSVFYGEEAFFIPVHQALNDNDLLYFVEVFRSFIQKLEK